MIDVLRVATWWALRLPAWFLVTFVFRMRVAGAETAPRTGGYLLLGNHTSTFDSVWVAWPKRASKVPTDITEDVLRREG